MRVDIGYAWRQLIGARRRAAEHEDEEARAAAAKKAAQWEAVIAGMQAGTIDVGSRTPTEAPAWVTLDVATGGFSTGGYTAGGPLLEHERALAARCGFVASRAAGNIHYLGSGEARELLASGRYRIDVPEEGALLVAAWLRERGEAEKSAVLVETLAPWFETLRFFPAPATTPVEVTDTVRLQDVGDTVDKLDSGRRQVRLETQRAAELVWKPLQDRAIALWIETVEGDVPRTVESKVIGGWPGRRFPDGWRAWVHALVADCRATRAERSRRAFQTIALVEQLARLATHPNALDDRTLGEIRRDIARFVTRHGVPSGEAFAARRAEQARAVSAPLHVDLRRVLVDRLQRLPRDAGLELGHIAHAVTADEAERFGVPAGTELPGYMIDKVAGSWDAPLDALVERGVIPSCEVLAGVLPQLTSEVRAAALPDEAGRRLYGAIYRAFRRRRSLLLLDYAHQVRFHELPWVQAMEDVRAADAAQLSRARQLVARVSATALRTFPHTITPNKLVTELRALAGVAKVELPLVEELAADIFMGGFTSKFVEAAKVSARLLHGTLYPRYYGIDDLRGITTGDDLAALCRRRAGITTDGGWAVARNGKVIEQCQILTTHNLGVLFDRLALSDRLAPDLRRAAEACFVWILRQLQLPGSLHDHLIRLKSAAYAWRQMIFYLSFTRTLPSFVHWAREQLAARARDPAFRARFEPAMRGLELAARGIPSSSPAFAAGGGRVLVGWTTERHWLVPELAA